VCDDGPLETEQFSRLCTAAELRYRAFTSLEALVSDWDTPWAPTAGPSVPSHFHSDAATLIELQRSESNVPRKDAMDTEVPQPVSKRPRLVLTSVELAPLERRVQQESRLQHPATVASSVMAKSESTAAVSVRVSSSHDDHVRHHHVPNRSEQARVVRANAHKCQDQGWEAALGSEPVVKSVPLAVSHVPEWMQLWFARSSEMAGRFWGEHFGFTTQ
jgi:hypothetical protein